MKAESAALVVALAMVRAVALSQLSGYGSALYSSQSNPLHNYQENSDHIEEGYVELNYAPDVGASALNVRYVGGLVLFDRFRERNYYEHSLDASLSRRLGGAPAPPPSSDNDDDSLEVSDTVPAPIGPVDTTDPFLFAHAAAGARHDRSTYSDYDNQGLDFSAGFRIPLSPLSFALLANDLSYRSYTLLSALSNVADVITARFGTGGASHIQFGALASAGVKHYTETAFDTSQFETRRTFIPKQGGKGKGGAILHVPSSKRILINPQASSAFQITGGLFFNHMWSNGSLKSEFDYRWNAAGQTRYLAQYARTTFLNQDIYNDFFNYEGPGLSITFHQTVFLGIQIGFAGLLRRDRYSDPALDLLGNVINDRRIDLKSSIDVFVSRYADVVGGVGVDVTFLAELMRNQSNDDYNDYSSSSIAIQFGIGF